MSDQPDQNLDGSEENIEDDDGLVQVGHGDDFIPLDNVVSEIAGPIWELLKRFVDDPVGDNEEGESPLRHVPWKEILGTDHGSLRTAEALSQSGNLEFDAADFLEMVGIEVTREFWDAGMPGASGFYREAYLTESGVAAFGRELESLVRAVDDWRYRTGRLQKHVAHLQASLARLEKEAKEAEEKTTRLAISASYAKGRLVQAREEADAAAAELARLDSDHWANEVMTFARDPAGRYRRDGLILVDPEGRIWRIHGRVNQYHHRRLTDPQVALLSDRGAEVIDVIETFDGPPPPHLAHPRFGRTYEGWTVTSSRLRVEGREDLDPEAVRRTYQAWAAANPEPT